MITFKNKFTKDMIGKALKIGDVITNQNGISLRVVGITLIEVNESHIIIEGYGIETEY